MLHARNNFEAAEQLAAMPMRTGSRAWGLGGWNCVTAKLAMRGPGSCGELARMAMLKWPSSCFYKQHSQGLCAQKSGTHALALAIMAAEPKLPYRNLGRTGLKVGLGSVAPHHNALVGYSGLPCGSTARVRRCPSSATAHGCPLAIRSASSRPGSCCRRPTTLASTSVWECGK